MVAFFPHPPHLVALTLTYDYGLLIPPVGYGILRFMTQHPYSPHVVYSLLRGRPLVVVGSAKSEQEVRTAVNALWLFVPGHSK